MNEIPEKPLYVDVGEIERCLRYFKKINEANFRRIVWQRNGETIPVASDAAESFLFLGLSNRDFPSVMGWMPEGIGIRVTTLVARKGDA